VRDARVGAAHHITSVSADVLLRITRHSASTASAANAAAAAAAAAAATAAAPKLAWACQGANGASVWSITMSQVR
jgi:hypothetical protein